MVARATAAQEKTDIPVATLGYSALSSRSDLSVSAERASSDVLFTTPQFASQPNVPAPDFTVRLREEFERGHFQVAATFRDIAAFLGNGDTGTAFGWSVNTAFGVSFNKDNVIFAVAAGHRISRYSGTLDRELDSPAPVSYDSLTRTAKS